MRFQTSIPSCSLSRLASSASPIAPANGVLTSTSLYDPDEQRLSVRLLWLTLADITSAEVVLRDAYKQQLPKIRAFNGR